jgi:beta-aspartyl-dipeptidase (metallo-type)
LYESFKALILEHDVSLEDAISVVSSTPAQRLKLHNKGKLKAGCDADIVLCNKTSLDIVHVLAKGKRMVTDGKAVVKGTFE